MEVKLENDYTKYKRNSGTWIISGEKGLTEEVDDIVIGGH